MSVYECLSVLEDALLTRDPARIALLTRALADALGATGAGVDRFGIWARFTVSEQTFRMRWVRPGTFLMGSPPDEVGRFEREGPQHAVTISRGLWLGEVPVTVGLWAAVGQRTPLPSGVVGTGRPELAMWHVSWVDCGVFCEALGECLPGLRPRLPTEAEREYACRAGTTTPTWLGGSASEGDDLRLAREIGARAEPHLPVGAGRPNPWGLYDMLGNVEEWCADGVPPEADAPRDSWGIHTYGAGAARRDPCSEGHWMKILRGSSSLSPPRIHRSAYRSAGERTLREFTVGLRLAGDAGGPRPDTAEPPPRGSRG